MYLIRLGDMGFVLCCLFFGVKIKLVYDMGWEFKILNVLFFFYDKVFKLLLYIEDESVIGVLFYVMERV